MNIYQKNTTNFNNNGLGFLTDIISAEVVDELNGEYSLTIEYPINGHLSEYLVEENYIKGKVADGTKQIFIIKNVEKTFDTIKVYANHIFYLLIDNFLENVAPTNLNGEAFLNWILARTNYQTQFVGHSNIGITKSARYVRKNPVEAILGTDDNSMVNIFGGEIKRDNFDIYFNSRIGTDNGVKLLFGKNISEINITIDTSEVYTRIMPVGYDGLLLPEKYVDSPLINNYLYPKICKYEFDDIKYDPEDEEAYHTLAEAYQALRDATAQLYVDGIDKPKVNIKIDWIELSKTNEYKQYQNLESVNLGDTIHANILGIEIETRVIKTIYNPLTDMIETFEIGTPEPTIASYQNYLEQQVQKINPSSILEQAQKNATELINSGFGGNVRIYPDRILIMDTDDEETARKVWQWNINGLGYSSTGINGPYDLAMTIDGQIVADFITTGHLNTSVIEGYDSLVEQVSKIYEFTNEVKGTGQVVLTNGRSNGLISLSMTGEIEALFPSSDLFPSNDIYPLGVDMYLLLLNTNQNQRVLLPIDHLYTLGTTSDEFQIYSVFNDETELFDYKARVIRRIEVDAYGNRSIAQNETIEELGYINVNLYNGETIVKMESFNNVVFDINYYINNDITDSFATKAFVNSSIKQTADTIELEVSKKVGDDEIISKINQSAEQIQIEADKISLAGKTIEMTSDNIAINSTKFSVDKNGYITATGGTIGGFTLGTNEFTANLTSEKMAQYTYTSADLTRIQNIIMGSITPTTQDYNKYDFDNSGTITTIDYVIVNQIINGIEDGRAIFNLNTNASEKAITLKKANGTVRLNLGIFGSYIHTLTTNNLRTNSLNITGVIASGGDISVNSGKIYLNADTGNITCVSVTQTSKEENKKNFEKYNNALKEVLNTDIYKYNFKDEDDNKKKHIGFVIGKKFNYSNDIVATDENNKKIGADVYSMVSVLWEAVKEQQEIINKLEKRIEVLENEK